MKEKKAVTLLDSGMQNLTIFERIDSKGTKRNLKVNKNK